jgi:lipoprotein-anchoring transpeptidase ErfK/SrfK
MVGGNHGLTARGYGWRLCNRKPTTVPRARPTTRKRLPLVIAGVLAGLLVLALAAHVLGDVVAVARTVLDRPAAPPVPSTAPASVAKPAAPPAPKADGPFVVKSILPISGPLHFGQYYWDESKGEPGPVVITVDLTARVLSVFENGHEVGATAILKGYGDKPTPQGVFPITQKDATHVSNIYDAPMPWMLRLTNDGVSIHGSKVERGYATNGCIGVPDAFAEKLFHLAHLGDRVIITDGRQMKLGDPIITQAKS